MIKYFKRKCVRCGSRKKLIKVEKMYLPKQEIEYMCNDCGQYMISQGGLWKDRKSNEIPIFDMFKLEDEDEKNTINFINKYGEDLNKINYKKLNKKFKKSNGEGAIEFMEGVMSVNSYLFHRKFKNFAMEFSSAKTEDDLPKVFTKKELQEFDNKDLDIDEDWFYDVILEDLEKPENKKELDKIMTEYKDLYDDVTKILEDTRNLEDKDNI